MFGFLKHPYALVIAIGLGIVVAGTGVLSGAKDPAERFGSYVSTRMSIGLDMYDSSGLFTGANVHFEPMTAGQAASLVPTTLSLAPRPLSTATNAPGSQGYGCRISAPDTISPGQSVTFSFTFDKPNPYQEHIGTVTIGTKSPSSNWQVAAVRQGQGSIVIPIPPEAPSGNGHAIGAWVAFDFQGSSCKTNMVIVSIVPASGGAPPPPPPPPSTPSPQPPSEPSTPVPTPPQGFMNIAPKMKDGFAETKNLNAPVTLKADFTLHPAKGPSKAKSQSIQIAPTGGPVRELTAAFIDVPVTELVGGQNKIVYSLTAESVDLEGKLVRDVATTTGSWTQDGSGAIKITFQPASFTTVGPDKETGQLIEVKTTKAPRLFESLFGQELR